jgi:hypothetical protein
MTQSLISVPPYSSSRSRAAARPRKHERRSSMRGRRFLAGTVVIGGMLMGLPATAFAQTLVPCNETALKNAVAAANSAGGGTLNLTAACTYTLTTPASGDNGLAVVTTPIRINGNRATITRSSPTDFRFFEVSGGSGNLTLNALTLRNGRTDNGGAITVGTGSRLTLSASTVTGNTATAAGGGIFSLGTVEVDSSALSNNTAIQGGGFNNQGDTATVTSSTVTGNHAITGAAEGFGGGILTASPLTLNNTFITGNDATGSGASGGGVWNFDTLTLIGSPVQGNVANGDEASGGGLWNAASLSITDSPILGNTASGTTARGGGVFNETGSATLRGVSVVSNRAVGSGADGGGIFRNSGTVTLTAASVAGNQPGNCGNPPTVSGCS